MATETGRLKATRFCLAGLSNMVAQTITHPIDVIKIRMQCQINSGSSRPYKNMFSGMSRIAGTEGVLVLLTGGLYPALLREASFSTIRMGGYEEFKRMIEPNTDKTTIKWRTKMLSGMSSGGIAAFLTTPTDVLKVRLQSEQGSSYPNTHKLLVKIAREEGIISGLWRGTQPNIIRAMIGTSVQISSYDHTKNTILKHGVMEEGPLLHFMSSVIAGFCTATAYNPVDVVKSRMQAERRTRTSTMTTPRYRNTLQTLLLIARTEGIKGWYKGWLPCWTRIAPHTCITFLVFEQLRLMANIPPI